MRVRRPKASSETGATNPRPAPRARRRWRRCRRTSGRARGGRCPGPPWDGRRARRAAGAKIAIRHRRRPPAGPVCRRRRRGRRTGSSAKTIACAPVITGAAYAASPASKRSRIVLAALAGSSRRPTTSSSSAGVLVVLGQALLQARDAGGRCTGQDLVEPVAPAALGERALLDDEAPVSIELLDQRLVAPPRTASVLTIGTRQPRCGASESTPRSRAPSCRSADGRPC